MVQRTREIAAGCPLRLFWGMLCARNCRGQRETKVAGNGAKRAPRGGGARMNHKGTKRKVGVQTARVTRDTPDSGPQRFTQWVNQCVAGRPVKQRAPGRRCRNQAHW